MMNIKENTLEKKIKFRQLKLKDYENVVQLQLLSFRK